MLGNQTFNASTGEAIIDSIYGELKTTEKYTYQGKITMTKSKAEEMRQVAETRLNESVDSLFNSVLSKVKEAAERGEFSTNYMVKPPFTASAIMEGFTNKITIDGFKLEKVSPNNPSYDSSITIKIIW